MSVKLSVVIVNWNVKECLRRCLASIYTHTKGIDFDVFVVDNDSSDGSQDMVQREFSQVHLIANSENAGFATANNQALEKCEAAYVLFLNPDTELLDNALQAMVAFMDAHPAAGSMGCRLINPDGSLQHSCRSFPSLFTDLAGNLYLDWMFPKSPFFNRYRMGFWEHDRVREVEVPAGACLLVRHEVIKKIGPFDMRFFMYYDEIDLCYRIKKNGWKTLFVPSIEVVHYTSQSSKQVPMETVRRIYRSRLLYFEKHYGAWAIMFLFFSLAVRTFLVWGIFPLSRLLCGNPRDNAYIKDVVRVNWTEYIQFIKPQKGAR